MEIENRQHMLGFVFAKSTANASAGASALLGIGITTSVETTYAKLLRQRQVFLFFCNNRLRHPGGDAILKKPHRIEGLSSEKLKANSLQRAKVGGRLEKILCKER